MQRHLLTKTIVIVATILICIFGVTGLPTSKAELVDHLTHSIHLGLDLKGGSHLILQVQVQDALKSVAEHTMEALKEELRKQNINYTGMERNDPSTVEQADSIQINIHGVDQTKTSAFRTLVADHYQQWILTGVNATDYRMNLKPSELVDIKRRTVEQARETILNRVDQLGVAEPVVTQHGRSDAEYEILVELPGVDDPARVKDIIGETAQLEIVEVKDPQSYPSQEAALAAKGGILPLNTRLAFYPRANEWHLISRTPVVTGEDLRNARAARDDRNPGRWEAGFTLSQDGGKRFERFTGEHINDKLAVVLDNQIRSVATILSKIGDSGQIEGLATEQEASDLALVLRTGSLPAGIVYEHERTVGPSLGADSIREGIYAGLAGLAAVIVVMLIYYKKSGLNAVLALILNTIILVAALSYFKATLSLPGIAGMILTVGMAVDSNVLIFERIREELRSGKAIIAAVDAGFGKAWWTIVDTHVTTIVSCLFLFLFGSGPVRGFAVTLVIGLLANVFTAVFVSKVIFEYELSRKRQVTELSI